jgi:predicted dehydrogenase
LNAPLKIAIIGCGRAAELIYLPVLKKFHDVAVPAVVDPIEGRRMFISKRLKNCTAHNIVEEDLIERIDGAVITTPPDKHMGVASEFLKHNKFILVEKPLALSMSGINELIETEAKSEGSLMMAFNHRYWRPVAELSNMLSVGHSIQSAEIKLTGDYSKWNAISFKSDPLDDLGPHLFDLIRCIFKREIHSISACVCGENFFQMKVKIGGNVTIRCGLAHCEKTTKSIKIETNSRSYFLTLLSDRTHPQAGLHRVLVDLRDMIKRKMMRETSPIKRTYEIQLKNFCDLIRSKGRACPGIKDGVAAISAVQMARASINENGKEILLDENS